MPEENNEEQGSQRPFWSGTISFGLVSIPVELYVGQRRNRVSLRMLGPDGSPLSRRYFAPESGRELGAEERQRGYEVATGEYVTVTDAELEKLAPEKTRDIQLKRFVITDSIPPMYFDRAYYLTPAGNSNRAYRLLAATMEESGRAGVATFVMRGREYVVAIYAENGILRAETLRYADELRTPDDIGLPARMAPDAKQVKHFEKAIVAGQAKGLDEKELRDEATEKLRALIEQKSAAREVVTRPEEAEAAAPEVIDILEVLRRSLGKQEQAKGPKQEQRKPARKAAKNERGVRVRRQAG